MLRLLASLVLCAALAFSAGCSGVDKLIVVEVRNPYDLQVEVFDSYTRGAHPNAFVYVVPTGDGSHTGADGWTDVLSTPANAQVVTVQVSYYRLDGAPETDEFRLNLDHATVTKRRVHIDTRPRY